MGWVARRRPASRPGRDSRKRRGKTQLCRTAPLRPQQDDIPTTRENYTSPGTPLSGGPEAAAHLKPVSGAWRRDHAKHAEGRLAVTKTITSDLVEAYSLCPRKAFLLMTGATMNPGPHDYELVIREQAHAN